MGVKSKVKQESQIIKCIIGWARNTGEILRKGETLPASSNFVLTSFVQKLCSIHRKRTLSDETGDKLMCDNHHYLYIALRLTYEIHLTAKSVVSMLLREIFLCEGSLQAIFSMLFDTHDRADISMHTYTLYPRWQYFDRSAFEFFVTSICPLGRDDRENDGIVYTPANVLNKKFLARSEFTTPLQAATICGDAELVLLLLRHGADPLVCYRGDGIDFPQKSPVGFTIDTLNISTMLKGSSWVRFYRGTDISTYVGETTEKALLCLTYFSRAVFALDIRESSQKVDTTCKQADDTLKKVHFEVLPCVTEAIGLTSFRQPPSLRHACRCVIRDAVSRAGREAMPQGVKLLQLPSVLTDFLDLLC